MYMFDFYEKRKLRGIIFSKITAGALFLAAGFLAVSAYDRFVAEQGTRERREERAAELMRAQQKAAALEAKVRWMESERGVEEAMREQFDVAKQGEEVIVIVDESLPADGKKSEVFPLPEEESFLKKLEFW
jgi:cell division protein FtsB